MKDRLTKTSDKGGLAFTFDLDITCNLSEIRKIQQLGERLKEYEDLEEQGLLLRLPCKVGDTVYRINTGAREPIIPMEVREIAFIKRKKFNSMRIECIGKHDLSESCYLSEHIGDKLYLTRDEAEKALANMKGDSNG